jgi:ankyrin repeat protein
MALLLALPEASGGGATPQTLPGITPEATKPWMETALFASDRELKALLDTGLNPNDSTPAGTSVLMMASADPQKVKLLIERGANVQAKSRTGYTALMTAAVLPGTSASVRFLLEKGAQAKAGAGVLFNASALFLAAFAGDTQNVALLRSGGADIRRKMLILGIFPVSPLLAAALKGDADTVSELIRLGAQADELDQDKMTPLHWTALGNRTEVVKVLLAAGAKVDAVDRFGYTPLLYASTIDFGDTSVAEALLKSHADLNRKTPEGRTPLAQAQHYRYPDLTRLLEAAGVRR